MGLLKYVIIAAGSFLLLMLLFQLFTGLGILNISPKYHKQVGITLFFFALVHGMLGLYLLLR